MDHLKNGLPLTEAGQDIVLDARTIPHAVRHGAVLGAVDQLKPGMSMVLVAPHDPLPLLEQMRERFGDRVGVDYESKQPQEVRVRLTKTAP
ncbi:DUF2249 domain-containing protein [Citricoccus sp. NPDC055426]|uniref:DUF2249 domain-containing protein n=1 Tax=Citricoccus sp. NPDC055426 TaxID=3155536 RepID=UPI00342F6461